MNISLSGDKVRLRAVEPEDADLIHAWENDTAIWLVSSTLSPFSKAEIVEYIRSANRDIYTARQLRLMIETNENQSKTIGAIDLYDFDPYHLRAGVGILISGDENRRKGYATDALKVIINYCFNFLHLKQLYCSIPEGHDASIRLFESLGFMPCGRKHQWLRCTDRWIDELMFQLINSKF
ncbi:MAG TPA: GNAT family N-acetyltransferase [Salinivirgaceae bacterium]|nr:GNAT family N-acetyltransferase [Salinivirgaceae bacterium]